MIKRKEQPCKGINKARDAYGCGTMTMFRKAGLCPDCYREFMYSDKGKITAQPKPKKCKGTGVAKGLGCGQPSLDRKYGLCKPSCYADFLMNTEAGQQIIQKQTIKTRTEKQKQEKKEWRIRKEGLEIDSHSIGYFQDKLQGQVNKLVRIIDEGSPCISSGKSFSYNEKFDAGHYFPVSTAINIRFNLLNIHAQCVYDNREQSGNQAGYAIGLVQTFGKDYFEWLQSSRLTMDLGLNKIELEERRKQVVGFCNSLEKSKDNFTIKQRIAARRKYMKLLFNVDVPLFEIEKL